MIFRFNFSGTLYTVAISCGVGGWVPLSVGVSGTDDVQIQAALDYTNGLGGGRVFLGQTGDANPFLITQSIVVYGRLMLQGTAPRGTHLRLADGANTDMFVCTLNAELLRFVLTEVFLHGNRDNNASGNGIYFDPGTEEVKDFIIRNVGINNFADRGVHVLKAWGNRYVRLTTEYNGSDGVYVQGSSLTSLIQCKLAYNDIYGLRTTNNNLMIYECEVFQNEQHGIYISGGNETNIVGGYISNNGQDAVNTYDGIYIIGGDRHQILLVFIDGGNQQQYGINIAGAGRDDILIVPGIMINNVTAPIRDAGTGTKLPTIQGGFPLSNLGGTATAVAPVINTSPGGIDIDADTEFTHERIPLGSGIQQIVRIKIWAYSNVIEAANHMLLRLVAHGATSSELWSGNPIDVVNKESVEEGGIVQYDVIHWIFDASDDAQMGTLAANDFLELLVVGEAADAPRIATDALFGGYEFQYV